MLAGQRLTFWQFIGTSLFTYAVAFAAMVLGGILGMVASALIAETMTVMLLYGLLLFGLQRPGTALIVIGVLATIHILLLRARVPAGLFWLFWSKPGLHWMEDHGF
jgi:hypothetical protein